MQYQFQLKVSRLVVLCVTVLLPVAAMSQPVAAPLGELDSIDAADSKEDQKSDELVVITDTLAEPNQSMARTVLDRATIERSGALDVATLLRQQTSLTIDDTVTGTGVTLQGLGDKHVLILIDGQVAGGRVGGVVDLRRLRISDIERIEIVRGASTARYGSHAVAGVIHIITRSGRENYAAATIRGGNTGTRLLRAEGAQPLWGTDFRGHVEYSEVDAFDLTPDEVGSTGSGAKQWQANLRARRRFSDVDLDGRFEFWNRDMRRVDIGAGGAVFDRQNVTLTTRSILRADIALSERWALWGSGSFSSFGDDLTQDQRGDDQEDRFQRTDELLLQARAAAAYVGPALEIEFGAMAENEQLTAQRLKRDGNRGAGALYTEMRWQLGDLRIVPGARVEYDSFFGSAVNPKLSGTYTLGETRLRASYGRGFRAPGFRELILFFENPGAGYIVDGNEDLKAERGHSLNIGIDGQPSKRVSYQANLFYNRISNLITPIPVREEPGQPILFQYQNVDSAETRGAEVSVSLKYKRASVTGNYTFVQTNDLAANRPLPGRPVHVINASVTSKLWPGAEVTANARAELINRFPAQMDGTTRAPSLLQIDARLRQSIGAHFELRAAIDNVTGAGDPVYRPLRPRIFWLELTVRTRN